MAKFPGTITRRRHIQLIILVIEYHILVHRMGTALITGGSPITGGGLSRFIRHRIKRFPPIVLRA